MDLDDRQAAPYRGHSYREIPPFSCLALNIPGTNIPTRKRYMGMPNLAACDRCCDQNKGRRLPRSWQRHSPSEARR